MSTLKGSTWNKWDLHLHTPSTKLSDHFKPVSEEGWERYCQILESSDVVAFGITDYFCCKNYLKLKEKHLQLFPQSTKQFFCNVELRLDVSVNPAAEEVNIHIIFNNDNKTIDKIEKFLSLLQTNITDEHNTKLSCADLKSTDDFSKAAVSTISIEKALQQCFGTSKPYLIVAASGNAGIRADTRSPRKLNISDEIDKLSHGFFGNPQNKDYYLKHDRYEDKAIYSVAKPVFAGCDAHSFENLESRLGKKVIETQDVKDKKTGDVSVKDITICDVVWIKGEPTFEGLSQVKFEPNYRISIGELEPRRPIRKIESVKFNFPEKTIIKKDGSNSSQLLCLNKLKNEIYFSDFFTCIIGGRGTGKSTIINLIGERLGETTDFFGEIQKNAIYIDDEKYDLRSDKKGIVQINGAREIEFISQGKIERLAEGQELTNLIFQERLREDSGDFYQVETEITETEKLIDNNIANYNILNKLINDKTSKETDLKAYQNVLDSINDTRYKLITESIEELGNKILRISESENRYSDLINRLRNILLETKVPDSKNDIDARVDDILKLIKNLDEIGSDEEITISLKTYDSVNESLEGLKGELEIQKQALANFFAEKGTSPENVKDSQNAAQNAGRIKLEVEAIQLKIDNINRVITENETEIKKLANKFVQYHNLIEASLKTLNKKLIIKNENVLNIKFEFSFDKGRFEREFFDEFSQVFASYHIPNTQRPLIRQVLYLVNPDDKILSLDYKSFMEILDKKIDNPKSPYRRINNYVQMVTNVFSDPINFLIYQNLIRKHYNNLTHYIKIDGYYGNRELSLCSFGQRCTAVIVTLLMTGVKPLIIDEPEAHLDNKLIADYLVELLKEKKQDRQIIFATHNSNFVINGDSELIHILEVPDKDIFTQITSTTIENSKTRQKLLKLEGGKEAFKSRENKYRMTS